VTIFVKEIRQSRPVETDLAIRSSSRVFHVWDDTGALIGPETIEGLFGTATNPTPMPAAGQTFPGLSQLKATEYHIEKEDDQRDLWRVVWDYEEIPGGGIDPGSPGYTEWNFSAGREFAPMWRTKKGPADGAYPDLDIPPFGDVANNHEIDIFGIRNDTGGEPGTGLRLTQLLEVSKVYTVFPNFASITAAVGRRNSTLFYGAAIGSLVMLPCQSQRIAKSRFRLVFRFAWDEFFHLIQVPMRDINGIVIPVGGGLSFAKHCAREVYWRQPFMFKYDFNTLLTIV
jgi:hypothetical protein